MASDVIMSSQVSSNKEKLTNAEIDSEPFILTLSDEDSDWESDVLSSNKVDSAYSSDEVITSSYSESPILFEESASISSADQTVDKLEPVDQCASQIIENHQQQTTTSKITCQTIFSQETQSSYTFPGDCCLLNPNVNESILDEISTSVEDSGKAMSNLDFDYCPSLILHNVVACVVLTYPVREIWCKSKKRWHSMANILIGDYNNQHFRLVLWNQQCHHALYQCSGNLVFINQLQVNSFCNETVFRLQPQSKVITMCSLPTRKVVNRRHASLLKLVKLNSDWFQTKHKVLCSNALKNSLRICDLDVQFKPISKLECGKVVHVNVRLASIGKISHNKNLPPSVCVYGEEKPRFYCNLHLNGSSRTWISSFKKYRCHLWQIRFVACVLTPNETVELHTTVFSTAECVYCDDPDFIMN